MSIKIKEIETPVSIELLALQKDLKNNYSRGELLALARYHGISENINRDRMSMAVARCNLRSYDKALQPSGTSSETLPGVPDITPRRRELSQGELQAVRERYADESDSEDSDSISQTLRNLIVEPVSPPISRRATLYPESDVISDSFVSFEESSKSPYITPRRRELSQRELQAVRDRYADGSDSEDLDDTSESSSADRKTEPYDIYASSDECETDADCQRLTGLRAQGVVCVRKRNGRTACVLKA